jgi:hypothetical protein
MIDDWTPLSPEWREALEDSGVHPATIYAMERCGFVVHPGNLAHLTPKERQEWRRAIAAWFEANDPLGDPETVDPEV